MEKSILRLFIYKKELKFNEMEKSLKVRSNKLAYHLKKLVEKNILDKENDFYKLSKTSEYLIPYISNKRSVLPVVLIHLGNDKKCFLYERKKRPFKDKLGLPGGRLLVGESISDCVKRIMKEKHNLNVRLKKINSISIEHVSNKNERIHSFLLIFTSAMTKDEIPLSMIEKNKLKIISSDYNLLKNKLSVEIEFQTLRTKI